MTTQGLYIWSRTAASNATADGSINWSEGQPPSSVNDSARAMMARAAEWRDDVSGTITTAGTSTAYTVTSNQGFDTLAHMNGAMIAFVPHATNGATVTLNVDGLGAKPLRYGPSLELQSGMLIQGTPYIAVYNNSDAVFYLRGFNSNPYGIPLGGMLPYVGSSAPNTAFALPFGQAISRTTYATLFSLISTTFGSGDGTTTFNLPDLRGRAIFGLDNMGGSAASRITNSGSSITGTTLGASGGAENVTVAQANLPSLNWPVTDTGHTHQYHSGDSFSFNDVSGSGSVAYASGSGGVLVTATAPGSATTGITVASGGSGTALNKMPPAMVLPYILRVI